MRKYLARSVLVGAAAAVMMTVLLAGTALATPARAVEKAATDVVLTLTAKDGTVKTFTLDQIKAMNTPEQGYYEGYAGFLNSANNLMPIHPVRGVRLTALLALVGYDYKTDVRVLAIDGYPKVMSPDAVNGKGLITYTDVPPYKPVENPPAALSFNAIIVYEYKVDGALIEDATKPWLPELPAPMGDGPLRMWFAYDSPLTPGYVVDGDWVVKWVNRIQVTGGQVKQWSFKIKGPKKTSVITRKDYESCTAPSCHGNKTVRYKGHSYSGLPLYYFAGKVDDNKDMNNWGDFNRNLARKGYTIQFVTSKGKAVSISSKLLVNRPQNIILAWKKDGKELTGSAGPLWLRGPVTKIKIAKQVRVTRMNLRNVPK
jgi:hypothetical protein